MNRNAAETVMGAVVLIVAAVFLFFAYNTAQVSAVSGYQLTAKFSNANGLKSGGDVRISGIKVGSILTQHLDPKTFQAVVTISLDPMARALQNHGHDTVGPRRASRRSAVPCPHSTIRSIRRMAFGRKAALVAVTAAGPSTTMRRNANSSAPLSKAMANAMRASSPPRACGRCFPRMRHAARS